MNILNFSGKPVDDLLIIQPTKAIRGYTPKIEMPSKLEDRFYLTIGCQGDWIDKSNIEDMIRELNEEVNENSVESVVIVHKKDAAATPRGMCLMDTTDLYFITDKSKALPKTFYTCSTISRSIKPKYFSRIKAYNNNLCYKGNYTLETSDRKILNSIFKVIHQYYFPELIEESED